MKPRILVTRQTFPEVIERLGANFEVEHNQDEDRQWTPEEFRERAAGKAGVLTAGTDRVDGALLDACPGLRAVCNVAVGFNNFILPEITACGVLATNTAGSLDDTTADLAFALMLSAARRITEAERWLRAGLWKGWKNEQLLGVDVHGATLGIVGMGRIGQALARRACGFDMKLLYHNRGRVSAAIERDLGARWLPLDELLREADFVSLNLPYSPATRHLIDARRIALMKPTAVLVNTARGGIVDDSALVDALRERRIAAAGLDVFEGEPAFHPGFLELDNVALAPHIGSATRATRLRMWLRACDNLEAALDGRRPPNLLNPEAWEMRRR